MRSLDRNPLTERIRLRRKAQAASAECAAAELLREEETAPKPKEAPKKRTLMVWTVNEMATACRPLCCLSIVLVLFEAVNVPAMYVAIQAIYHPSFILLLKLASRPTEYLMKILTDRVCSGNTTEREFACDVKEKLRYIARDPLDLAGRDLTGFLTKILTDRGHSFGLATEREFTRVS